jgi:tripartite ATP-independent transporter DctM subunit
LPERWRRGSVYLPVYMFGVFVLHSAYYPVLLPFFFQASAGIAGSIFLLKLLLQSTYLHICLRRLDYNAPWWLYLLFELYLVVTSIILILYAILTGQSIGALFAAALVPGMLAALLYMAAILVQVLRNPALGPAGERLRLRERLVALGRVWDAALLILLVIGGIYGQIFSPTEAAAVGAGGALLITAARGRLSGSVLLKGIAETAGMTGMIFLILIGATIFNYFIELSGLTTMLTRTIQASGLPPLGVLLLVILFYLVLGCFMDALSMVLLTVVPMYQLVTGLGYDPIWFGILVVTVAEIGLITPPIGMNLFVIQGVTPGLKIATVMRGILPFILADAVRIVLLIAFPALALFLPGLFGF